MRTDKEIERALKGVEKILRKKIIYLHANAEIREGYKSARLILMERLTDTTLAGIDFLNSHTSKAIARLAIDYLNGDITLKTLCSVKLKQY